MMARAKAKAAQSKAYLQLFWDTYGIGLIVGIVAVVCLVVLLWGLGLVNFGSNTGATQLAPGTDEHTISEAAHYEVKKNLAPVNKRLDSLEAGQKALNADVSSIKSDIGQLKGGQAAIQNRKLDLNLLKKYMDELDKQDPPTKPVSRLEGVGGNFPQSLA